MLLRVLKIIPSVVCNCWLNFEKCGIILERFEISRTNCTVLKSYRIIVASILTCRVTDVFHGKKMVDKFTSVTLVEKRVEKSWR